MMTKLFVYGTLKDPSMPSDMCVLGTLYDLGPFPGLKLLGDSRIPGQVIEVTDSQLEALDKYEGAPFMYVRKKATAFSTNEISDYAEEVWVYEYNREVDNAQEIDKW